MADVRGVRVALLVGVRVVLSVVGDPVDDRALDRHRAGGRERVLERLVGCERPVGEHPVVADGDPDRRDAYIPARITRSVQPTPRSQSTTIAARTATKGRTTAAMFV